MSPGLLVALALLDPAAPVPKEPSPLRRLNEEKRATARELFRVSRKAMDGPGRKEEVEADLAAAARAVRDANLTLGADPVAVRRAYRKECRATEATIAALIEKGLVRPSLHWRVAIRTLDAEIDLTANPGELTALRRAKRDLAGEGVKFADAFMACDYPGGLLGLRLDSRDFAAALRDADLAAATRPQVRADAREAYRGWWEWTDFMAREYADKGIALPVTALQVTALRLDAEIDAATRPEDRRGLLEMKRAAALEAARLAEGVRKHNHSWRVRQPFPAYDPAVTLRDTELALLTAAPDRVAACERCVAAVRRFEADQLAAFASGITSAADYLRVKLARLDAEVRLAEEGGRLSAGPR